MTWHGTSVYIMDPVLGQLVAWYAMEKGKNRKEEAVHLQIHYTSLLEQGITTK